VFNGFEVFLFIAILLSGMFTVLMSKDYMENFGMPAPEYYSLILFGLSAMMFLVSSNNLIMVFLSIEFMSICAYILTGYIKGDTEAPKLRLNISYSALSRRRFYFSARFLFMRPRDI
jgi:NADH:ubiquinone oxidoreductase subunit 2 (chain N)